MKMKAKKCATTKLFRDKIDLTLLEPEKMKISAAFACEIANFGSKGLKAAMKRGALLWWEAPGPPRQVTRAAIQVLQWPLPV
ncbi:hypothetical protein GOB92_21395 [Sinorhizobium meliloti]|nr:hypothetical protein [Sinorhizobium meliloti]